MDEILEIIKYTIPSLVVLLTAYYILKTTLDNEQKKLIREMRMSNQKIITPIRLQAYERIALFLERISPESMILRIQQPQMTCGQMQSRLLSAIRSEFEHNLSQQIYMSIPAWEVVKNAKENIVKIINTAAANIDANSPAIELSKIILDMIMKIEAHPTKIALEYIKNEAEQFFS
ncbi:MAG: hypothetical protein HY738_19945 [Bacteroidia bacterium]|nr:hypothetical protein [Bacteroidia bacterium]